MVPDTTPVTEWRQRRLVANAAKFGRDVLNTPYTVYSPDHGQTWGDPDYDRSGGESEAEDDDQPYADSYETASPEVQDQGHINDSASGFSPPASSSLLSGEESPGRSISFNQEVQDNQGGTGQLAMALRYFMAL